MRRALVLPLAAVAGAAVLVVLRRVRRAEPRRDAHPLLGDEGWMLPPEVSGAALDSDAPLRRDREGESRYERELEAEQELRHAAAERLKADPFNARLEP